MIARDQPGQVLVIANRERAALLTELMRANGNDPEGYAIATLEPRYDLDSYVREGAAIQPWDVVVLDGASIAVDGEPSFEPLVTLRANAAPHTLLLYVAPHGMTMERVWLVHRWADEVVREDALFDIAIARRVENAALARTRWARYRRMRRVASGETIGRTPRQIH